MGQATAFGGVEICPIVASVDHYFSALIKRRELQRRRELNLGNTKYLS